MGLTAAVAHWRGDNDAGKRGLSLLTYGLAQLEITPLSCAPVRRDLSEFSRQVAREERRSRYCPATIAMLLAERGLMNKESDIVNDVIAAFMLNGA